MTDAGDVAVPDDLAGLDEPVTVALLLTQVAAPEPLAAVCSLAGVRADAVASGVGAIAVLADPGTGEAAAAAVSRLLTGTDLVLVERRAGAISAVTWSGGTRDAEVAPGLVLAEGPGVVEDLLLGEVAPGDLEGTVASSSISRLRALRLLTKAARKGRRG